VLCKKPERGNVQSTRLFQYYVKKLTILLEKRFIL